MQGGEEPREDVIEDPCDGVAVEHSEGVVHGTHTYFFLAIEARGDRVMQPDGAPSSAYLARQRAMLNVRVMGARTTAPDFKIMVHALASQTTMSLLINGLFLHPACLLGGDTGYQTRPTMRAPSLPASLGPRDRFGKCGTSCFRLCKLDPSSGEATYKLGSQLTTKLFDETSI